jgi:hypothetical protein
VIAWMIGAVVCMHAVIHRFAWAGVSIYLWYAGVGSDSVRQPWRVGEGECRNTIEWPEKGGAGLLHKDNTYCIQMGLQLHLAPLAQFNVHKSV